MASKYFLLKRNKKVAASRTWIEKHDTRKPAVLGDCSSDQIELAEQEAEDPLQQCRAQGDTESWICVVARDDPRGGGLIVSATGLSNDATP